MPSRRIFLRDLDPVSVVLVLLACLWVLLGSIAFVIAQDVVDRSGLDLPVHPEKKKKPSTQGRPLRDLPEDPPHVDWEDEPPKIFGQEVRSENRTIFYVLDISGSMAYDWADYVDSAGATRKGNRLDRAKAEIVKSVGSLPDGFRFDILAYDCSLYLWSPTLREADPAAKADAIKWTYDLAALGGTGTGPATAQALRTADVKLVILATDGQPNCLLNGTCGAWDSLEGHRQMIRMNNVNLAAVNVYGIGAFGEFRDFCRNVAADSGGTYTDVR